MHCKHVLAAVNENIPSRQLEHVPLPLPALPAAHTAIATAPGGTDSIPETSPVGTPQQAIPPVVSTPHACQRPVETIRIDSPGGTMHCRLAFVPQHAVVFKGVTAHVKSHLQSSCTNTPLGELSCPRALDPKQTAEPSDFNTHAWLKPTHTSMKGAPAGGVSCALCVFPGSPQHDNDPDVVSAQLLTTPAAT